MDVLLGLANLPQILITWAVYFGAGVLFLVAGLWAKRRDFAVREFLGERFPFNLPVSRSARLDVKVYVIGKLTDAIWAAPGIFLSTVLPLAVTGVVWGDPVADAGPGATGPGPLLIALVGVVLFLTIEFAEFVTHYAEHKVPVLWELHKVHHSAASLNPLTAKRGHPFCLVMEGVMRALFFCVPAAAAMHVAGLSIVEVIAVRALVGKTCSILTLDPIRHSPFPVGFGWLDRLFVSPHMHQVHHSSLQPHWDKNFGTNLSLFDWVFRTGYKPVRDEPLAFGLAGYSPAQLDVYHTLYGTYLLPLSKVWRLVAPVGASTRRPRGGVDGTATSSSSA